MLLPGLAYILISAVLAHQWAQAQSQAELVKLVRLAAGEEQQSLTALQVRLALVAALAADRATVIGGEPGAGGAALNAIAQALPTTSSFAVWTPGGDLVCSNPIGAQSASAGQQRWFPRAVASRAFSIGDFWSVTQNGQFAMICGYPVFGSHHELIGVVSADLDQNQLIPMFSEMAWPADTVVTIFDHTGTF